MTIAGGATLAPGDASVPGTLNGRQWLARRLDQAGIAYRQADNCFPWIEDWRAAQKLMDQQLATNWGQLNELILGNGSPIASGNHCPDARTQLLLEHFGK